MMDKSKHSMIFESSSHLPLLKLWRAGARGKLAGIVSLRLDRRIHTIKFDIQEYI